MVKISLIIPIYNSENYLKDCLSSILAQNFPLEETEILLIDNNSTDNSKQIIESYEKSYSFIKSLTCKTKGASAVRNFGVQKSTGKYLWFIDSDDYIAKDALKTLYETAERKNSDFVSFSAKRFDGKTSKILKFAGDTKNPDYKNRFVRSGLGPWAVFIRKKFFTDNNLYFHEGIIQEDIGIMSSYILYTDNFVSVDKILYFYRQHENSVLHQKTWNKNCFDIFIALSDLYQRFEQSEKLKTYYFDLEWFSIWNLLIDSADDFGKFKEGRSGFARSRKFLKTHFKKWYKNPFLLSQPKKVILNIYLNYFGLRRKNHST